MKSRVSKFRLLEFQDWVKKNKHATWHEFVAATGGTRSQYYRARDAVGVKKNLILSQAMKKVYEKKYGKKDESVAVKRTAESLSEIIERRNRENEAFLAHPTKDSVIIEGTTPDFIWYEIELLQRKIGDISSRLANLMKVSQGRDSDQKKMLRDLISENSQLRVSNNAMRQQIGELTEMINGAPV